jgi:hypothetical protein
MNIATVKKIQTNRGQAMLFTMIFVVMIATLVVYGVGGPVVRDYRVASEGLKGRKSYFLAESGVEDAYYRLKNNISVANSETFTAGGDTTTITTADLGNGIRQITSVGNVSSRQRTLTSKVQLVSGTTIHLNGAVQVGLGGFIMDNGSSIIGDAYANGNIQGGNTAQIQGSAYAATSMPLTADQINDQPTTPASSITFGNTSATADFAQSFQLSTGDKINKVRFYIKKVGSPGNITARIVSDNAGSPSTTTLTSLSLSSSLVSTSYGWIEAAFTSNPILDAGTTYWLVLDASSSSSNYYMIGANSAYTAGAAKLGVYAGTWGTTRSDDGYFSVWIGGITSIISGATITGSANAYTVNNSSVTGTLYCKTGSGNNKTCNTSIAPPSPQTFPVTQAQIDTWKANALAGGTYNGSIVYDSTSQSYGARKIVGNLTLSNNAVLTLTGTLWITGNLVMSNGSILKLASSYGSALGVVVVDGTITTTNNAVFQGSGASGSYVIALTTTNSNSAISISNNAGAVILYAPYGGVDINNNGIITQITAETVHLNNGASVSYNTNLSDSVVSEGAAAPTSSTSVVSWKETE